MLQKFQGGTISPLAFCRVGLGGFSDAKDEAVLRSQPCCRSGRLGGGRLDLLRNSRTADFGCGDG